MTFALLVLFAYGLGAIPFGVLVARAKGVDILKAGSGNIGATNVGRVLGKGPGLAVWGLDVLKSLLPTLVARGLIHAPLGGLDPQTQWFLVGAAAIVGHCASPFLGFRGGKGISTALGAIVGTAPLVALLCFGLFALVLATVRYMAIASIVGVSSVVLFAYLLGVTHQLLPVFALLAILVAYLHRSNLRRLRAGTEPRFSFKKAGAPPEEGSASGGLQAESESASERMVIERLQLAGSPQLPDPYEFYSRWGGSYGDQIVDSILTQYLESSQALHLVRKPEQIQILFDDKPNGQLPVELASGVLRRLGLLAGMDPLQERQPRKGVIKGTFDGEPFVLNAEAFPAREGIAFALVRNTSSFLDEAGGTPTPRIENP